MAAGKKVPGSPPRRNAPFNPSSVRPAGKNNPVVKPVKGKTTTGGQVKTGIVGMSGSKAKSGIGGMPRVSGATYTPGKGTKVTPAKSTARKKK